jgi:hypothetical protein
MSGMRLELELAPERRPKARQPAERFSRFQQNQRLTARLERVKGIEPSYSAWKGIGKPNDLKGSSEK